MTIKIKYNIETKSDVFGAEDFYSVIKGNVRLEDYESQNIGILKAELLNLDLMEYEGCDFQTLFLSDDWEMQQFSVLFTKNGNWKIGYYGGNLLIIKIVQVYGSFLGLGIGAYMIRDLIRLFCRWGLVLGYVQPLQIFGPIHKDPVLGLDTFKMDDYAAFEQLLKYYIRIGFKRFSKSSVIYTKPQSCPFQPFSLDYMDSLERLKALLNAKGCVSCANSHENCRHTSECPKNDYSNWKRKKGMIESIERDEDFAKSIS